MTPARSVLVRPAEPTDLAAVGALHARSRVDAYAGLVPDEALRALTGDLMGQWWTERRRYERETHQLAVAVEAGEVIGFSYTGPDETPGSGQLYALHVDPRRQGTGVGRLLMMDALTTLHEAGLPAAVLWVLVGNARARGFYERGGWSCDGVEQSAPMGAAMTRQVRYSRATEGATSPAPAT